ncbi:hypothetical protein C0Q70_17907 [Pomacea canaliculata]|uniref:Major facilitator superfamily (MFS) profile domain-containing protein n=1 Tax=Pomacea canaliculata TaxID=400727 RepID=A0A2T7NLQ6_POMCA|nr:hypothetical protein C0Q70_17907 [Pomacea canaliculata]
MVSRRATKTTRAGTSAVNDEDKESSDGKDDDVEETRRLISSDQKPWCKVVFSYPSYVLLLLLLAYLLNQLDRYMLAITIRSVAHDLKFGNMACFLNTTLSAKETLGVKCNMTSKDSCLNITNTAGVPACAWDYNGQGLEYQILAGPIFILDYTFMGILATALLLFWETSSLLPTLTNRFDSDMLLSLADYVKDMGWRWAFYISGMPGIILAILIFLSVREPQRTSFASSKEDAPNSHDSVLEMSPCQKLCRTLRMFSQPSLILLCLGGSLRNAAGYVWAYNSQPYFEAVGESKEQIGAFMSWVPLVGGSLGVILGGKISDVWVNKLGPISRVLVLTASQLVAAPFAAATLLFKAPVSFSMQIPTYIIGEMWVGVALAVLVELVGSKFKTTAIAVYLFVITNIGGCVPLLVPPIQQLFENNGYNMSDALRGALYVLYPAMYIAGGLVFLLTVGILRKNRQHFEYATLQND